MLTNLCKLACIVSLFIGVFVGCGDDTTTPAANPDLAMSMGNPDLSKPATAGDMTSPGSDDGGGSGAKMPLCGTCTADTDCMSPYTCTPYSNGATKKCSHSCTTGTEGSDCPGVAMCNNMGVCKCN